MIATGDFLHVQPISYRPASAPIVRSVMIPVGTINLYVGFTGAADLIGSGDGDGRADSATLPQELSDRDRDRICADTAPIVESDCSDEDPTLQDDADLSAPASYAGSITPASIADSIAPVSNAGDFEDGSVLGLLDCDSEPERDEHHSGEPTRHTAVLMAGTATEGDQLPLDPFTTPITSATTPEQLETLRKAMETAQKKELEDSRKFQLQREQEREITEYRQRRGRQRLDPNF